MASPNINIITEPEESGRIVYLALAPKTNGAAREGQLSLKLIITNNETTSVKVTMVNLTFQGGPAVEDMSYSPMLSDGQGNPVDFDISAGATEMWFFQPADSVLLPQPAPHRVRVEVTCQDVHGPLGGDLRPRAAREPCNGRELPVPSARQRPPYR